MRYTIIFQDKTVFYSDRYEFENDWNEDFHFMIIDNYKNKCTTNGKDWIDIEDDHL